MVNGYVNIPKSLEEYLIEVIDSGEAQSNKTIPGITKEFYDIYSTKKPICMHIKGDTGLSIGGFVVCAFADGYYYFNGNCGPIMVTVTISNNDAVSVTIGMG